MKRAGLVSSLGSVGAATLASSCCWLPLLLIAVGAGSAFGMASTLETYRIPFAILALGALGTSFYLTYRKPKAAAGSSDESCCAPAGQAAPETCPCCGGKSKNVASMTVKALSLESVPDGQYFICPNPECALVYHGAVTLMKQDLRVRVGFKEADAPHTVCYCFSHTVEEIEEQLKATGQSTVEQEIREKIKAGACDCEIKNPKGSCCLGDVARVTKGVDVPIGASGAQCTPGSGLGGPAQCAIAPAGTENHADC